MDSGSPDVGFYKGAFGFDGSHVQSRVVPGETGLSVPAVGEAELGGRGASGLSLVLQPLSKLPALLLAVGLTHRELLLEGGSLELIVQPWELHDRHTETLHPSSSSSSSSSSAQAGGLLALDSHCFVHDSHEGPGLQLRFPLEAWLELEPLDPAVPPPPPPPPPLSLLTSMLEPRARDRPSRATEWVDSLSDPLEKLEERGWYICRGPGGEELLGDMGW
ncbi:hypothetical protein INR49_026759 [Caranx melampygus]|nr:hypothetical protein INR49_026759 [Caranx melampygus]